MVTESQDHWPLAEEGARQAALLEEVKLMANEEFVALEGHLLRREHITRLHLTLEGATVYMLDGGSLAYRGSHEELKRLLDLG